MTRVRIYHRDQLRLQLDALKVDRYTLTSPDGSQPPLVDGYYNVAALGAGGFGVVTRAKDPFGLSRAIKFASDAPYLHDDSYEALSAMRELQITNARPFKHILPIIDFGIIEGESVTYYVSQYVDGLTLRAFCQGLIPLRVSILEKDFLRRALRDVMLTVIRDVLSGLVELHAASVAHLNIKPQNIMVYSLSGWESSPFRDAEFARHIEVRDLNAFIISDICAKPLRSDVRGRTALRWTPYYFPPLLDELKYEHADGGVEYEALDVHGRTIDLYSLGRTLEVIFLDRVRRHSPYFRATSELETSERAKEEFWKTVFHDDHVFVEEFIERLLSLKGGFGTAQRAKQQMDSVSYALPQNAAGFEELIPTASPREARLRIFLCHASDDKPRVRELYEQLKTSGIDVWLDEEALLPGEDWRNAISKAVRSSHIVVVCLSKTAVTKRGYLQKEIRLALDAAEEQPDGSIFLVPVRLDECDIPTQLARWQVANLFSPAGYSMLLRSLRTRAEELHLKLGEA